MAIQVINQVDAVRVAVFEVEGLSVWSPTEEFDAWIAQQLTSPQSAGRGLQTFRAEQACSRVFGKVSGRREISSYQPGRGLLKCIVGSGRDPDLDARSRCVLPAARYPARQPSGILCF